MCPESGLFAVGCGSASSVTTPVSAFGGRCGSAASVSVAASVSAGGVVVPTGGVVSVLVVSRVLVSAVLVAVVSVASLFCSSCSSESELRS